MGGHRFGQLEQHEDPYLQLGQRGRSASIFPAAGTLKECCLLVRRYLVSWLGHDCHCCQKREPGHGRLTTGDVRMPSNQVALA